MDSYKLINQLLLLGFVCSCRAAFIFGDFRQMSNPSNFMDPNFSLRGQSRSQTQDESIMQSMALDIVQSQAQGSQRSQTPPQGSRTENPQFAPQGIESGEFQSQDQKQPGVPAQTATQVNGRPATEDLSGPPGPGVADYTPAGPDVSSNRPNGAAPVSQTGPQTQGRGTSNVINVVNDNNNNNNYGRPARPNQNLGLQQTVSNNNMFNPGNMNSMLVAPPGTGDSQFNNNMGSVNSMLNKFGGGGLSIDASKFFQPRQNPDGTISGAAGNFDGPPIMGPGMAINGGSSNNNNNKNSNNDNYNNNNNFNSMFSPPNFFMNPGSSFSTRK